jgi:hypothetical protein
LGEEGKTLVIRDPKREIQNPKEIQITKQMGKKREEGG